MSPHFSCTPFRRKQRNNSYRKVFSEIFWGNTLAKKLYALSMMDFEHAGIMETPSSVVYPLHQTSASQPASPCPTKNSPYASPEPLHLLSPQLSNRNDPKNQQLLSHHPLLDNNNGTTSSSAHPRPSLNSLPTFTPYTASHPHRGISTPWRY